MIFLDFLHYNNACNITIMPVFLISDEVYYLLSFYKIPNSLDEVIPDKRSTLNYPLLVIFYMVCGLLRTWKHGTELTWVKFSSVS